MKSSNIKNYIKENTNLKGTQKFKYLDTFNICMMKDRIPKEFNKEKFIKKYKINYEEKYTKIPKISKDIKT